MWLAGFLLLSALLACETQADPAASSKVDPAASSKLDPAASSKAEQTSALLAQLQSLSSLPRMDEQQEQTLLGLLTSCNKVDADTWALWKSLAQHHHAELARALSALLLDDKRGSLQKPGDIYAGVLEAMLLLSWENKKLGKSLANRRNVEQLVNRLEKLLARHPDHALLASNTLGFAGMHIVMRQLECPMGELARQAFRALGWHAASSPSMVRQGLMFLAALRRAYSEDVSVPTLYAGLPVLRGILDMKGALEEADADFLAEMVLDVDVAYHRMKEEGQLLVEVEQIPFQAPMGQPSTAGATQTSPAVDRTEL
eukprot:g30877.t1